MDPIRGSVSIEAQNIMPIIKKWLYSDKDIFIREVVSNASDAITKLRMVDSAAAAQCSIRVEVDKAKKELRFIDDGVGMTADEVATNINQVAFSGAKSFLAEYAKEGEDNGIIGHFGLGFYSVFMVSDAVEIDTLSFREGAEPVHWESADGMAFEMTAGSRTTRGTTITLHITDEDVNHIRNVLRMRPGEQIEAVDEDRTVYLCRISEILPDEILADVLETEEADTELQSEITLYMGLPKGDKMELIIQKAVELGVSRIVPVSMKRSIVKLDAKKAKARIARWQAIAQAAAKQSKRSIIPEVGEILTWSGALEEAKALDVLLLPYENALDIRYTKDVIREIRPGQSVGVFIGPEGGFDRREVETAEETGAKLLTLGKRILRTETAAISMLSILMYELEG